MISPELLMEWFRAFRKKMRDMENRNEDRREPEIVYSHSVKAGKRIYYLDVKRARNNDLYLCITESKRKSGEAEDGPIQIEKHRLFLYKEDFAHFSEGLKDVMSYVQNQLGEIEERQYAERKELKDDVAEPAAEPEQKEEEKKSFFSRLMGN